ncbi:hypothetical protein LY76DRAFT_313532 [Colletotrichum caudatum]|nr:hypothetical protein LY76DRAFT_313532 [Colletotrichum caudatum]
MQVLLKFIDTGSSKPGVCSLCAQHTTGITGHHAIPGEVVRNYPGRFTDEQRTRVVWLCQPCHRVVHYLFDNEQLAMKYNSIDQIVTDPRVMSWLFFTKHYSPDDVRHIMLRQPQVVHGPLSFEDLRKLSFTIEAILEQIWKKYKPDARLALADNPGAMKKALRLHGLPLGVTPRHIQFAMRKRPEWAGWYYHVFVTGKRRRRIL